MIDLSGTARQRISLDNNNIFSQGESLKDVQVAKELHHRGSIITKKWRAMLVGKSPMDMIAQVSLLPIVS